MTWMTAYVGFWRETEVGVEVKDLGAGAGETDCFECRGTGDWPFHPDPALKDLKCVCCKGTGRVLIGIA